MNMTVDYSTGTFADCEVTSVQRLDDLIAVFKEDIAATHIVTVNTFVNLPTGVSNYNENLTEDPLAVTAESASLQQRSNDTSNQVLYPKFSTVKHIKCYNKAKGSSEKVYSCNLCGLKSIPLTEVFRHVNKECFRDKATVNSKNIDKSDDIVNLDKELSNEQPVTFNKEKNNSQTMRHTSVKRKHADNSLLTNAADIPAHKKRKDLKKELPHSIITEEQQSNTTNLVEASPKLMAQLPVSNTHTVGQSAVGPTVSKIPQKPYSCSQCNKTFVQKNSLQAHMVYHSFGGANCNYCGALVKNSMLLAHMKLHSRAHPYQCLECDKGFIFDSTLKEHIENQHSNPEGQYKCRYCGRHFLSQSSLTLHQRRVHNHIDTESLLCPTCGKSFTTRSCLAVHESTVHKNERKFIVCPVCDKRFTVRKSFLYHMSVHDDRDTCMCKVCGQGFRNESTLLGHMLCHSNERPFACRLCESTFKRKRNLNAHMRFFHGVVSHTRDTHTCSLCNKTFISEGFLKEHMRIHNNERPYHCRLCGQRFCHYQGLYHHKKKTHTPLPAKRKAASPNKKQSNM